MDLSSVARLLQAATPSTDVEIDDLHYDSRAVTPGSLFFCWEGRRADGHLFAPEAISQGAVALVVSRPLRLGVPELLVRDPRRAMGRLAAPFFDEPSRKVPLVGITGTNGKTTAAFLLESIFAASGQPTGLIGTVETRVAGVIAPGVRTTPEAVDIQRLLSQMVKAGVVGCPVEVTSIGLAEGRVEGCEFRVAIFTNLTRDHLEEYHGDMESYFLAKAKLFTPEFSSSCAINIDDAYGRRLIQQSTLPGLTYGTGKDAEIQPVDVQMGMAGSEFRVVGAGLDLPMKVRMPGPFNIMNAVAAVAGAHLLGLPPGQIAAGIDALAGVPGRFESIDEGQEFAVIVDYAHTPDSLANILSAARAMSADKVIVVFGCGGDRDRSKRSLMGEAAGALADLAIATSDNPRSEDPGDILKQVESGLAKVVSRGEYQVIEDRRHAIRAAIETARPGDVVVIAGKGHETGQEFADRKIPFDDRIVAAELLRAVR